MRIMWRVIGFLDQFSDNMHKERAVGMARVLAISAGSMDAQYKRRKNA